MQKVMHATPENYGLSLMTVVLSLSPMLLVDDVIDVTVNSFVVFFMPVIVSTWYSGLKVGILATSLTAIAAYFFLFPANSLVIGLEQIQQVSLFLLLGGLILSAIATWQTSKQQSEAEIQKLQTKQEQLTNIFETITDVFIHLDAEWRFVYVNSQAEKLLGKTRQELIGKRVWEKFPSIITSSTYRHYLKVVLEQVTVEYEEFNPIFNKLFSVRICPLTDGLTIYLKDITKRQQAEKLQNQQKWFEDVLNLMPTPMLFIEPGTARITFANKAAEELAGGELFLGKTALEYHKVYHCTDANENCIPDEKMPGIRVANGERLDGYEMNLHTPKGVRSLILFADTLPAMHGYPATSVMVFQEITKLKQTKAALLQSQSWLQTIVENTSAAIYVKDIEGRYLLFNGKCEEICNIGREKVLGKTDYDFLPYEIAEKFRSNDKKVIELGMPLEFEEVAEFVGKQITAISLKCPLYNPQGIPYAVCGISTEITDRKRMEEALRQQAEKLAQANRTKDEFLAIVSHELRTPLNAILGWAQMLCSRKLNETMTAIALNTIERNAKIQKQIVEDILDVADIITGKLRLNVRLVELVPVVEAAINTVLPAAQAKEIKLQFVCDPAAEQVLGDSDRLQQVIWNLLSNAIKFTPNRGKVDIELFVERGIEESCSFPLNSSHFPITEYAVIQVKDTGIGISPEFLPFVFYFFSQADGSITRSYGGLGLGLSIVRYLVELHGGTVCVNSEGRGKGATFTVKLPLARTSEPTGLLGYMSAEESFSPSYALPLCNGLLPLFGCHVLVVDEDPNSRDFLCILLEAYGAQVTAVASSDSAFEVLERLKPDALLSDIKMLNRDGYGFLVQQRGANLEPRERLPATGLAVYVREEDSYKAIAPTDRMHLSKPIDPAQIVKVVAKLAARSSKFLTGSG